MREVLLNDVTSGIHLRDSKDFGVSDTIANADLLTYSPSKSLENSQSNTANLNHMQNPQETQETAQSGSIFEIEKQVTLYSKYGNKKATFKTTSAVIMLPLTKGGEYFVFDDVRFFVIAGEGALYYLDCVKAYDFENLEAECLEQFLLTGKQIRDYKQRELIKDFLTIDTKNIQKGKMYLLPKNYEALQIRIIGGCL